MEISPSTGGAVAPVRTSTEALAGLDLDDFLRLMIAEMRNQDPLNPMENTDILQTVSQIREIGATNKLNETLNAVLMGQNLSNATNLIGKQVQALDSTGEIITGVVDRVTIAGGNVELHIGDQSVPLNNIREILPAGGES